MIEETKLADENNITERELHFYYNREDRLAKASDRVRMLYNNQPVRRFAMFSSLTDSKPKAAMLAAIVVMCLVILFITYLFPSSGKNLAGNAVSASVMRYNGASFIVLKKKVVSSKAWTGIVDVAVSEANAEKSAMFTRQIIFVKQKEEEFRWSIPVEARELLFFLQAGGETTSFSASVE